MGKTLSGVKPKANTITLSLKKLLKGKYDYWNDYFGMKNIEYTTHRV